MSWAGSIVLSPIGSANWCGSRQRTVGLGCDGDAQSGSFVLDLPSLDVAWPVIPADTRRLNSSAQLGEGIVVSGTRRWNDVLELTKRNLH